MALLNHVLHARRDYPEHGIRKGDEYWWCQHHGMDKWFYRSKDDWCSEAELLLDETDETEIMLPCGTTKQTSTCAATDQR